VERLLVSVEGRNRLAERRPDAVIIDPRCHHEDQNLVVANAPCRDHLDLHGVFGRAVPLLADRPGIHLLGNVAEGRDLADFVQILRPDGLFDRLNRHDTPRW
jgi:hypothetical protein